MPSAICHEQITPGEWREHFCLVNPTALFDEEEDAITCAETDLNAAKSSEGADIDFAMSLRDKGYVKLDDFHRVN